MSPRQDVEQTAESIEYLRGIPSQEEMRQYTEPARVQNALDQTKSHLAPFKYQKGTSNIIAYLLSVPAGDGIAALVLHPAC